MKATRGVKGLGAKESFHFYRVLEELDGLTPARPEEYIKKFFVDNPEYDEFLPKALNIASKIPAKDLRGKNPRVLASVCIYLSSIGEAFGVSKPLLTQSEIASYFKVTNVSLMNGYHKLLPKLRDMNTMLTEEEIEWFLSYRKENLERT